MSDPAWRGIYAEVMGLELPPRHTVFTVNGTGVADPFGPGFAADTGRGVDDSIWCWQPIGYPAAMFPMGPSVQAGRTELNNQIDRYTRSPTCTGKIALSGYSQGALVTDIVWRDDILNPNGRLHHRLPDVVAIVNFGDPMRCPGIANGNLWAGQAPPATLDGATTGGIAGPQDLTPAQTPDFLLSFANDGDLYASAPVGDSPWTAEAAAGHEETLVFNIIQNTSLTTLLGVAAELVGILKMPLIQVIPIVEAIINGLTFAAQGTNAPHWTYNAGPAVTYLNQVGAAIGAM